MKDVFCLNQFSLNITADQKLLLMEKVAKSEPKITKRLNQFVNFLKIYFSFYTDSKVTNSIHHNYYCQV
jgi:hypothetical protein